MKRLAGVLAVLLLAAGCGGNDEPETASTKASLSAPPPEVSLHESCPVVEAALPKGYVPPASKWQEYAEELTGIAEDGDVETKNALGGLRDSADTLAADPADGLPLLDLSLIHISEPTRR